MASSGTYNHFPLIGRTPPRGCSLPGDTANPFAAITCPDCRARIAHKVAAERASAAERGISRGEQLLHTGTVGHYQNILDAA